MSSDTRPIIMAIDDDPVVLNLVVVILKKKYRLRPFTSARTAFKYLALPGASADLVLLDYHMADMNGPEVLARLRSDPGAASIPVVYLTGLIDEGGPAELLQSGASDFISKPPQAETLLAKVAEWLPVSGTGPDQPE